MQNKQVVFAIAKIIVDLDLDKDISTDSFSFRVLVQKIGYILQKFECTTKLKFGWYSLGPYSRTLQNYYSSVAETIAMIRNNNVDLELGADIDACVEKTESFLNDFRNVVGSIDAKSLEVLASLVMLCSDIYPKPNNCVEELLKRKKDLRRDFVEGIWRFLVDKDICVE